jgi:hypothetical protein
MRPRGRGGRGSQRMNGRVPADERERLPGMADAMSKTGFSATLTIAEVRMDLEYERNA